MLLHNRATVDITTLLIKTQFDVYLSNVYISSGHISANQRLKHTKQENRILMSK